ncbi:MAG: universal stress protein [Tannerellaceae bacterium]|nr:universal stress protein [Tannerellaceae bacterium]
MIIGSTPEGEAIRLLDDSILNGTIIMILITCIIASFATQKASQEVAIAELSEEELVDNEESEDRILIPVSYPENVNELINLAVTIKSKLNKAAMTALHVIPSGTPDTTAEKKGNKLLEKAVETAIATDNKLGTMLRYDEEPVNAIRNAVWELKITDIVLGLKKHGEISTNFLGKLIDKVLSKCPTATLIYRPSQPLSTVKRYLVVIPPNAEKEIGFPYWLVRL